MLYHNGYLNLIQMQIFCDIFYFDSQPIGEKRYVLSWVGGGPPGV